MTDHNRQRHLHISVAWACLHEDLTPVNCLSNTSLFTLDKIYSINKKLRKLGSLRVKSKKQRASLRAQHRVSTSVVYSK